MHKSFFMCRNSCSLGKEDLWRERDSPWKELQRMWTFCQFCDEVEWIKTCTKEGMTIWHLLRSESLSFFLNICGHRNQEILGYDFFWHWTLVPSPVASVFYPDLHCEKTEALGYYEACSLSYSFLKFQGQDTWLKCNY